jgi:hypothetical protein
MGQDKIRYFLFLEGRWRWRPTKPMREAGFCMVPMGRGGPGFDGDGNPAPSLQDKQRAVELNAEWDAVRTGQKAPSKLDRPLFAPGSVGDAYHRAMKLREAERAQKGIVWTSEQKSRDDWPRAWKWLGPEFGDCDPNTVQPENFLRFDEKTGIVSGLLAEIEAEVSISERHRTVKVWRALWKRMKSMKYSGYQGRLTPYVGDGEDPAKAFVNSAPDPRQASWQRREVLQHVQRAWRMGYHGLAACMAVAWDSMLSPVDARRLTPSQIREDAQGAWFEVDRAKTGKAAAATLSPWSLAILTAYAKRFGGDGVELAPNSPIFRNRSGAPYSKDTLGDDFRGVREAIDPTETRTIADMRRSGAVEGDAGGGSITDQSNKMANSVDANKRLRKTYNPVNIESVRRFDEARAVGAKKLEQKPNESVRAPALLTLFRQAPKRGGQ